MAGKFEITKAGDGTFSFEFLIDGTPEAQSPVFEKEDACRRGVKAVKKNSRMKVQNAFAGDEEKTNPKYWWNRRRTAPALPCFCRPGSLA